jgi:hypothetical protein
VKPNIMPSTLPRVMDRKPSTEPFQTGSSPVMALPTMVPRVPTTRRDEHRDDADDQGPDELGAEHLAAVRDQGEGREAAALAPLAGHREDADDRQDHRHRRPDRGREVVEGQLGRRIRRR